MSWTRTFKKCRVRNLYSKWDSFCSSCSPCSSLTIQDESSSISSCSPCSLLTIQDELSSNHVISRRARFYVKKWVCRAITYLFDSNRSSSLLTFDWIVTFSSFLLIWRIRSKRSSSSSSMTSMFNLSRGNKICSRYNCLSFDFEDLKSNIRVRASTLTFWELVWYCILMLKSINISIQRIWREINFLICMNVSRSLWSIRILTRFFVSSSFDLQCFKHRMMTKSFLSYIS